jgi:hypothetical protein
MALFLEVKRLEREAIHLPPSSAEVRNPSTPTIHFCGVVQRRFFYWNVKCSPSTGKFIKRRVSVGFEVLTAVSTKMAVFWVVAP